MKLESCTKQLTGQQRVKTDQPNFAIKSSLVASLVLSSVKSCPSTVSSSYFLQKQSTAFKIMKGK